SIEPSVTRMNQRRRKKVRQRTMLCNRNGMGGSSCTPPKRSATWGLHLRGVVGIIRNTDVAYQTTAFLPGSEASTHGSQDPSARGHGEHRSDRKTGRAPRLTHARVARPHERGRVWRMVPGQARGRVYRGRVGSG